MKKLIQKAAKRARACLQDYLNEATRLDFTSFTFRRILAGVYSQELWSVANALLNERHYTEDEHVVTTEEVERTALNKFGTRCEVVHLFAWMELRLRNGSYLFADSDNQLNVKMFNTDLLEVKAPIEDLLNMLQTLDEYLGTIDINEIVNDAIMVYKAEKKASEILIQTLMSQLPGFALAGDESLNVKVLKNGRLLCTLSAEPIWVQDRVFRTSVETFADDFLKAYAKFKDSINCIYPINL